MGGCGAALLGFDDVCTWHTVSVGLPAYVFFQYLEGQNPDVLDFNCRKLCLFLNFEPELTGFD